MIKVQKITILMIFSLCSLMLVTSCKEKTPPTPTISQFNKPVLVTTNPKAYEKLEMAITEKESTISKNGNPYDYNYFKLIGEFTSPSGKKITVPAFWYQDYMISFNPNASVAITGISGNPSTDPNEIQGQELVTAVGNPHYRLRLTPTESGTWTYEIKSYSNNELKETITGKVEIENNTDTYKGVLKVDTTNNRNFVYENGETFIPIGQNNAWYTSSSRKTRDYDVWFSKMNEVGMNTSRVWLATWGFALHWGNKYNNYSSRYTALARLDRVMDLADLYDIEVILTLNNHGQFSTLTNPEWDNNPWNSKNGGICDTPLQFFSKEKARSEYKNELLYIIARYSYCNSLFCWELFNEIDYVDSYSLGQLTIKNWHNEMALFIKENDPYKHMVTTSHTNTNGATNSLSSIDFISLHSYSYANKSIIDKLPDELNVVYDKYNKPVIQAELGINWKSGFETYRDDPNSISLHQGLWAGMMSGAAGGSLNWWWDSQINPNNLYTEFIGAASYAKLMNMSGSDYHNLYMASDVTISNSFMKLLGARFDNRIYGYLYDKSWTYINYSGLVNKTNIMITIPLNNGTYKLTFYDTTTGKIISANTITVTNNLVNINVAKVQYDIAFIIA